MGQTSNKQFYTAQDLRTQVKAGSFIFPYIKSTRWWVPAPQWGTSDKVMSRSGLLPYQASCSSFDFIPDDQKLRSYLNKGDHLIRVFPHSKVHHISWDEFTPITQPLNKVIRFGDPIGIYLGEFIQIIRSTRHSPGCSLYFSKILTLDGQIIWF